MPSQKADLITHPIRSRILTTLMGRQLTTQQIGALLPELPLSSIYRHVRLLVEGGVLEPVDEVRVNGALTRVYRVGKGRARITPEETQQATHAEHLSLFTSFLNNLAEVHRTYLEQGDADATTDPLHARMRALHLSPDEYREFLEGLDAFLGQWSANAPDEHRRRVVFAHIAIPDLPDPPLD